MRVSDAMSREVRIANPNQRISEAAKTMTEIDAGVLPVGEEDRLVGMITDRDIAVRAVAREMPASTKVREIMSEEVLYCFEDEDVADVAQNMSDVKVRRLPAAPIRSARGRRGRPQGGSRRMLALVLDRLFCPLRNRARTGKNLALTSRI